MEKSPKYKITILERPRKFNINNIEWVSAKYLSTEKATPEATSKEKTYFYLDSERSVLIALSLTTPEEMFNDYEELLSDALKTIEIE